MNIRRFKHLRATGMSYAQIGRECGCDWRTVRKYLAEDAPTAPPSAPSRKGTQAMAITAQIAALIDAMLRLCIDIKATVICERLADEHDVHVNYQRVKTYCRHRRPQIRDELGLDEPGRLSLHRRIATVPGAQAQVDWGDEGDLFGTGVRVYSFPHDAVVLAGSVLLLRDLDGRRDVLRLPPTSPICQLPPNATPHCCVDGLRALPDPECVAGVP